MYKITRKEAAKILEVSTRSIDRYIKSGKLRSKKEGKIVYIHGSDLDKLSGVVLNTQKVISPIKKETNSSGADSNKTLTKIYDDLKDEVRQKQQKIDDLSIKLGQMSEIVKNSISMIEFKRTQFLLEESKTEVVNNLKKIELNKEKVEKKLKSEKRLNILMFFITVILFLMILFVWYYNI